MHGGTGQSVDDSGDGSKIMIISHDTVAEKYKLAVGQIRMIGRRIYGILYQCAKMIQAVIAFCAPILQGAAQHQQHYGTGGFGSQFRGSVICIRI